MQTVWIVVSNRGSCKNFRYNIIFLLRWAEAPIKIARITLTIKLDGNWSSFQLANSAPPLSVTDSAIAPSARMPQWKFVVHIVLSIATSLVSVAVSVWHLCV